MPVSRLMRSSAQMRGPWTSYLRQGSCCLSWYLKRPIKKKTSPSKVHKLGPLLPSQACPSHHTLWDRRGNEPDGAKLQFMGVTSSGHEQKILHQCFWSYAFWFCSRRKYYNFPDSCCVYGIDCFWCVFFGWIINHHVPSYPSSIFDEWEPYEPRLTLVCLLIMAKHCYFVLEQPASSLLARHPRWEWFCNRICYVPWHFS